ncbi:MAG: hypothetical protein KJ000_08095 [Pirellulaceae bacterium]|nr:hypothetical protein [Pirellulaceae bacterium]
MYRLSIIVPLLGDPQLFEDTLVSVLQNRPASCEVLVVHPGRYEDPYNLSDEVAFVPIARNADAIQAVNAGLQAARGEIVHLLQPGILAEEGWTSGALKRFCDREIAAIAPLVLDAGDKERILSAGLRFSVAGRRIVHGAGMRLSRAKRTLRRTIVGPARMAAFYRRSVVVALGGFCPQAGPWFADIDLGLSMHRLGFRCAIEPEAVLTATSTEFDAPCQFETGRCAERVFWRHRDQLGGAITLPAHAAHVLASVLVRPHRIAAYAQLAGRLLAAFERSSYRDFETRMQRASEACRDCDSSPRDEEDDENSVLPWPGYSRRLVA